MTPQELMTTLGLLLNLPVLGQHYYVPNPVGPGLSPKWDFTSSGVTAGNPNAYVIGVKVGDLPSTNSSNIDNLMIKAVEGELASEIFRIDTNGGQPPSRCAAGDSNITVKYTARYCERHLRNLQNQSLTKFQGSLTALFPITIISKCSTFFLAGSAVAIRLDATSVQYFHFRKRSFFSAYIKMLKSNCK